METSEVGRAPGRTRMGSTRERLLSSGAKQLMPLYGFRFQTICRIFAAAANSSSSTREHVGHLIYGDIYGRLTYSSLKQELFSDTGSCRLKSAPKPREWKGKLLSGERGVQVQGSKLRETCRLYYSTYSMAHERSNMMDVGVRKRLLLWRSLKTRILVRIKSADKSIAHERSSTSPSKDRFESRHGFGST